MKAIKSIFVSKKTFEGMYKNMPSVSIYPYYKYNRGGDSYLCFLCIRIGYREYFSPSPYSTMEDTKKYIDRLNKRL